MDSIEREILLAVEEFDRRRSSLIEQFGIKTHNILESLESKKLILLEHVTTASSPMPLIFVKISKSGKLSLDEEFCTICECLPCDCNWGNDE